MEKELESKCGKVRVSFYEGVVKLSELKINTNEIILPLGIIIDKAYKNNKDFANNEEQFFNMTVYDEISLKGTIMKLLICSDIHGDFEAATAVLEAFKKEGCDRILMLGDILYHGPRNDLPAGYAPKKVIELLNANREVLMTVRGTCDTEVDQMVLNFPILAD